VSKFEIVPPVNDGLIGQFGFVFFMSNYPQVHIVLFCVVNLLKILRYGKEFIKNNILVLISFIGHVGIV